tara:strand:+ start:371 stop:655 length:285 start_codon:yes stop_codon:yes gene_type:complete
MAPNKVGVGKATLPTTPCTTASTSTPLVGSKKIQDNILVAWALENGAICFLSYLTFILDSTSRSSYLVVFFRSFLLSSLSVDLLIIIQKLFQVG